MGVTLYLLDSDDRLYLPVDRGITAEPYSGAPEMRRQWADVCGRLASIQPKPTDRRKCKAAEPIAVT